MAQCTISLLIICAKLFSSKLLTYILNGFIMQTRTEKKGAEMIRIYFDGITEMGCSIKNASILIREDYTMNQIVHAIKEAGYKMFMLPTMRRYVETR